MVLASEGRMQHITSNMAMAESVCCCFYSVFNMSQEMQMAAIESNTQNFSSLLLTYVSDQLQEEERVFVVNKSCLDI